jgi:hypothetical protein
MFSFRKRNLDSHTVISCLWADQMLLKMDQSNPRGEPLVPQDAIDWGGLVEGAELDPKFSPVCDSRHVLIRRAYVFFRRFVEVLESR